jgi:predicted phosphoribosyltransferase
VGAYPDRPPFRDRVHAGRVLARLLVDRYGGREDSFVLALPRGGVPVAYEVARALSAPLRVFGEADGERHVRGKTVLLVDEGLAGDGADDRMRAAVAALRRDGARRIVVAVPVCAASASAGMAEGADDVVCAETLDPFPGVGESYEDFSPTPCDEVQRLLERAGDLPAGPR